MYVYSNTSILFKYEGKRWLIFLLVYGMTCVCFIKISGVSININYQRQASQQPSNWVLCSAQLYHQKLHALHMDIAIYYIISCSPLAPCLAYISYLSVNAAP